LNLDSPFEDGQFDVVIAMMVIEHLFNPFHSFREVARLLRPGGYAFINLPIVTSVKNRARLFFGTLPLTSSKDWWQNEEWDGGHLHYFSIESVRRLSEKYQLELSEMYPCGRLFQLKRVFPTILCNELSFVFRKAT
jgi:SAM-dependent methyltransferase